MTPMLKRRLGKVDLFCTQNAGDRPLTPGTPLRRCSKCSDIPSSQSCLSDRKTVDSGNNKQVKDNLKAKILITQLTSSSPSPQETNMSTNDVSSSASSTCSTCSSISSESIVSSSQLYGPVFNKQKLPSTPNLISGSKEYEKVKEKPKFSLNSLLDSKNNNPRIKEKALKSRSTLPNSSANKVRRYYSPSPINVRQAMVEAESPEESMPPSGGPPCPPPAENEEPVKPRRLSYADDPPPQARPANNRPLGLPPKVPTSRPMPKPLHANPAEPAPNLKRSHHRLPINPAVSKHSLKHLAKEKTPNNTVHQDEGVMVSKDKNGAICFKVPGRVLHKTTIRVTHFPQGGAEMINIDDPFPHNNTNNYTPRHETPSTVHESQNTKDSYPPSQQEQQHVHKSKSHTKIPKIKSAPEVEQTKTESQYQIPTTHQMQPQSYSQPQNPQPQIQQHLQDQYQSHMPPSPSGMSDNLPQQQLEVYSCFPNPVPVGGQGQPYPRGYAYNNCNYHYYTQNPYQ